MKKLSTNILAIILSIVCLLGASQEAAGAKPSAKETVDKMVAVLKKAPSMEFVFTIWQDGSTSTGRLVVGGQKFYLTTPDMKIWFDGASQWSYLKSADEVNISRPTRDELAQCNPLTVLSSINNNFTFRRLNSPEGSDKIELVPNRPSEDFAKAVVTITTSTSMPRELTIYDKQGNSTTVKITSAKSGAALPISTFRFNPKDFPGVEVIDLR